MSSRLAKCGIDKRGSRSREPQGANGFTVVDESRCSLDAVMCRDENWINVGVRIWLLQLMSGSKIGQK